MKILESILDKNYPKEAVCHILLDNDKLVATNERIVIIKEIKNKNLRGLIINPKASGIEANSIYEGKPFFKGNFSYPNYKRILPEEEEWERVKKLEKTFMQGLYQIMIKEQIMIDILKFVKLFRICEKEAGKICFYNYKGEDSPVFLKTEYGYIFGILPIGRIKNEY